MLKAGDRVTWIEAGIQIVGDILVSHDDINLVTIACINTGAIYLRDKNILQKHIVDYNKSEGDETK